MKKVMILPGLCNNPGLSVKSLVRFSIVICMLVLLSGCVGMLAGSMAKSWVTGDTYGEMAETLAPPTDGKGRLFIYRAKSSTKISAQYGVGLVKNSALFTVDDAAYEIIWEVFRFCDLPEGLHEVTCGQDILKKRKWGSKRSYQKGANKIQVQVSNTADTFIRVDATEEAPFFQPVVVDNEQGRQEITKLLYQKKGGHTFHDGHITRQ